MARPKKEGMDYFPHDTDAVNDEKIEALRMLYGNDGYAFYFILLERIYRTNDFELDISDTETMQILCRKVDVTPEKFNSMLETSLKWGCFDRESYEKRGVLTSSGIKKRADVVVQKRVKMRKKYRQSKEEVSEAQSKEEVSTSETTQETEAETPQRKEKKSKGKKSIKDNRRKYADDSPYIKMVHYLLEKIQAWKPDYVFRGSEQTWADDFRKMHEIDKRSKEDIRNVIDWATNDPFWQTNILSAKKLREKFDTLQAQMNKKVVPYHPRGGNNIATHGNVHGRDRETNPIDPPASNSPFAGIIKTPV
ncbi:DUF4373 domain-containing protein [Desmospora activa]|uniref:Uncharacterized protein DUF4373 n=1 Tax=Desmospora activa DSM 45169 TaxID=1121389 RepID=A0A2T4Z8Z3_9BACL|nr:DUF4373 domain-containing protein [Desmospora activa]PTM58356.1 uncharacterized protein DUF4373 [Desmospora activa DSM 45169]